MNKKNQQKLIDYLIDKKKKREAKEKRFSTFMVRYFERS